MNLCTAIVAVEGEAESKTPRVRVDYPCVKSCMLVRACDFFKPMKAAGGEKCFGECHWFEHGCTCPRARKAALARAKRMIAAKFGWTQPE